MSDGDSKHKHIVVPADGESRDRVTWVCTKCWPGTNEVLCLGGVTTPRMCELCATVTDAKDLNPIWRSWVVRVLRRYWEEHKA